MKHLVTIFLLASVWANTEEGVFVQDTTAQVRATVENRELVLRSPISRIMAPKTKGILLIDSKDDAPLVFTPKGIRLGDPETTAKPECALQVILEQAPEQEQTFVVVLREAVFWKVRMNRSRESLEAAWLSLPIEAGQKPAQCLRDAGRVFVVDDRRLRDLRLSEEERTKPAKVKGQLSERELVEIRNTVFAMARQQILQRLAAASPENWPEILRGWPGRHGLEITVEERGKGRSGVVYYAPNAGYQMEQIDGKWTIVGG